MGFTRGKPKIWRPNFHVCLKISSKFQHNLGCFCDNYDHKTNSKVCWNFVFKIFSHGFYKHEFFKRRNSRMSALAKCEVVSTKCLFEHLLFILLISNSIISRAITENHRSPLIDGIFFVMRAVQLNARSACDASTFTSCIYIFLIYIYTYIYRKIYIHDVNVDASQADRALNWTARINKVVERVTQEQIHIF